MNLIILFDYIGTFVFAMSGTLMAADKRLDIFGAAVIGFVTAVGGGTLRDMMLGVMPVTWIRSVDYFYIILAGVVITILFQNKVLKMRSTLFLFDTIGIGVFTLIGLEKALGLGIEPPIAVIMGLSTAVVGGVIRDTLCNEVPLIFHKEIYATACIAGAILYFVLQHYGLPQMVTESATVVSIIVIRILAVRYDWSIPKTGLQEPRKNRQ
ncbi:MAG: trimeric intracellular cation channel family protein [Breznakibacter sp.]|nr:trimeric intracellular cation channel family protein [Breznakibacter sp.]